MNKPVVLTGLRANTELQLGNYFGALLPAIDTARIKSGDYSVYLFIPDLHSFTTPIDHSKLKNNILTNLKFFVAAGLPINSPNVYLYRQSFIPAHSELTWILNCFTGVGELSRMTQFKDKSKDNGSERVTAGLFDYPVLMAADILLYDAEYVPVGEDQTQHLEFTRNIADRMNKRFDKQLFTIPHDVKKQHKFFGKDQGLKIKDLIDPSKKMSKSADNEKGVIFLGDDPDLAYKKIMAATTDNLAKIEFNPTEQPGVSNLLLISSLLSDVSIQETVKQFNGVSSYATFKSHVATQVRNFLAGLQAEVSKVDMESVMKFIEKSEHNLSNQANTKLNLVQKAVGLR